jgi:hypothetical protein
MCWSLFDFEKSNDLRAVADFGNCPLLPLLALARSNLWHTVQCIVPAQK